jgi:hypothetical protein
MSLEASKRILTKATARDLDDLKKWLSTPGHSNLVDTAHAATNRNTDIQLTPLEAIER